MAQENNVSFKDTLNLPHTDFPIRPQPAIDDSAMVSRWESERLYHKTYQVHEGAEKYILLDGPPYANGHIHLGHAYNIVQKDIITKAYRMSGYHVPLKPGWDCHGLPIEIKVTQTNPNLERIELKKACRQYAQQWVDVQRSEFKRLGIVMDWDNPYITMAPSFEGKTVEAFGILLKKGFIQRKNKTVAWCYSCKTTLASAEIEYHDRKDPSIYVLFPLDQHFVNDAFAEAKGKQVSLLVWTTTPWTLPLNRAVLVKPASEYVLAKLKDQLIICGAQTLPSVEKMVGQSADIIKKFKTHELDGAVAQHPFIENMQVPLIFDESVGVDEGTAFVHCAPGCGPSDYEIGVRNKLEIFSPISADGKYTSGIKPAILENMGVAEAHGKIITMLTEAGTLFHKASITHSYPHCWRCRTGLIFRATKQWFFNLEHHEVKKRALEAVEKITFMPPQGKNFLRATIENRWEWCLSRQRVWGVPIPALLCTVCDDVYCTPEFVDWVAKAIAQEGVEFWDRVTLEQLIKDRGITCGSCSNKEFKKELDILDVWFDSGIVHYAVLYNSSELRFPADLVLEGIDQHRGWFQSSLLTAMVLEDQAHTKAIMTHGFTVDEKGQKMSKSLGNVVAPQDVIAQLGTDGLRLWVASVGNDGDAVMSKVVLANVGEVYRKIRNTARFLLANIYDFNFKTDAIPVHEMLIIDRMIIAYVKELQEKCVDRYKHGDFSAVYHALGDFCTVYLSSWYLDIIKDRLYVEAPQGHLRRSAQTACWYVLDALTRIMAPILSFTAEQLSDLYQKDKKDSIHVQQFAVVPNVWNVVGTQRKESDYADYQKSLWDILRTLRSTILKSIEIEREKGVIKHSLEAAVTIYIDPSMENYKTLNRFFAELKANGQSTEDFFKEFLIVSHVTISAAATGLEKTNQAGFCVLAEHAKGVKCPRCWNWDTSSHEHNLCRRCVKVLKKD